MKVLSRLGDLRVLEYVVRSKASFGTQYSINLCLVVVDLEESLVRSWMGVDRCILFFFSFLFSSFLRVRYVRMFSRLSSRAICFSQLLRTEEVEKISS